MARKTTGECLKYIRVPVTIEVCFPEDMLICDICDFCRTENSGTRFRCLLNSRILPYHNRSLGEDCPLGINQKPTEYEEE